MNSFLSKLLSSFPAAEALQAYEEEPPGSAAWLVGAEYRYGGIVLNVKRNKVSPNDPRSPEELQRGGMIGGDRMYHHGYAEQYAEYLGPFLAGGRPLVIAEFGILYGTGLAIWADLFPASRILGFDIDLGYVRANMARLRAMGAFRHAVPELYDYDQLVDNRAYLGKILNGDRIDVCMDDGFHSNQSIMTTLDSVSPHLSEPFVYFVEDNSRVHSEIAAKYPEFDALGFGELTVVRTATGANP